VRGGWSGKVAKGKRRGTSNPGIFGVKDDKGGMAKVRFTSRAEYPSFSLDANWFVKHGLPTVTIGAGQYEVHTLKEYVNLAGYVDGCRLAVALATLTQVWRPQSQ
jgi:hypothetical protein